MARRKNAAVVESGKKQRKTRKKKVVRKKVQRKKVVKNKVNENNTEVKEDIISLPPSQWYLLCDMGFGIINENFKAGTCFTVDWEGGKMRCDDTGRTYDNIRDLDIAIRLKKAYPVTDETREQYNAMSAKQKTDMINARNSADNERLQHDESIRARVIQSDQDLISSIDISSTKKPKAIEKQQTPTPKDVVSLVKPRHREEVEIIHSDGMQQSRKVGVVRPEVVNRDTMIKADETVFAGQHIWDVKKDSGKIRSMVDRKMTDYKITVHDNGQQVIRGMPVVRDDSSVSGGSSLNEGQVRHFTAEEMTRRTQEAQIKAAEYRKTTSSGKTDDNVVSLLPQDVSPSNTSLVDESSNLQHKDVGDKVQRLLKRRR